MVEPKLSVFLFIGEDNYLREKAIKDLNSSLLNGSSRELDYKIFYGEEASAREILGIATTAPFLASKRLIVIKNFEKLPKEDVLRIITYLRKPSESTCLVLETKDDFVLKEYDSIARYVNIKRFNTPIGQELSSWIRQFVTSNGKSIEEDAVKDLKELQGQNLSILAQELEKLITFIGERDRIKLDDVEALVGGSLTLSAFELTWAIEKTRIDDAIRIVSDLLLIGKKHYEIIGLLCWHFNRILKAKMLERRGESRLSIANSLKIYKRYSEDFFKQLDSTEIAQVRSKMKILLDADLDIKRTKFNPALILEFTIIRLCLSQ